MVNDIDYVPGATYADNKDKLDVYITNCDAVVHLVGDMTGADAKPQSTRSMLAKYPDLPDRLPPLRQPLADGLAISYTQWEAWLALYHGRLLVIAKADDAAPRGPKYTPTDASRAAQQEHLARLSAVERYPSGMFTSPDNLAKQVLSGTIVDLLADNRRIKIRTAVVAVVALLGMLAGYLAWDRHVHSVESAAIAKKNESTNEAILAAAQQNLALTQRLLAASQTQAAPRYEASSCVPQRCCRRPQNTFSRWRTAAVLSTGRHSRVPVCVQLGR